MAEIGNLSSTRNRNPILTTRNIHTHRATENIQTTEQVGETLATIIAPISVMISSTSRCFVYGTLQAPDVLRTLLGRVPEMDPRPAFLSPEYSRHPVKSHVFPGVIATHPSFANHELVKGILLPGLTPEEIEIFDYFEDEGVEYKRCKAEVLLESSNDDNSPNDIIEADLYMWVGGDHLLDKESSWSFEDFCTHQLPWYIRSVVKPCREEYDKQKEK